MAVNPGQHDWDALTRSDWYLQPERCNGPVAVSSGLKSVGTEERASRPRSSGEKFTPAPSFELPKSEVLGQGQIRSRRKVDSDVFRDRASTSGHLIDQRSE
ncbi:unnamed protein product [Mycena citricolor]|uniref:Uncharacterized protein n=1 Tax=Mycena citricolor TaxID=2018698 RepID=A0AAD2HSG1_9AGAR|nr:unnamed protein product [Mycena citricolor]